MDIRRLISRVREVYSSLNNEMKIVIPIILAVFFVGIASISTYLILGDDYETVANSNSIIVDKPSQEKEDVVKEVSPKVEEKNTEESLRFTPDSIEYLETWKEQVVEEDTLILDAGYTILSLIHI